MLGIIRRRKAKALAEKREIEETRRRQEAELVEAERSLGDLEHRAFHAIRTLEERGGRNHWRESIERMIQGA